MKYNPMIENYYQQYFKDGKIDVERIARNVSTIPPNVLTRLNFYILLELMEEKEKHKTDKPKAAQPKTEGAKKPGKKPAKAKEEK